MFYVLLILSIISLLMKAVGTIYSCTASGRAAYMAQNPHGSCTVLGPMLPRGCGRGTKVHEWAHMLTLAPFAVWAMPFTWVLFYDLGWLAALLVAWVVNLAVLNALETIADLVAMVIVGPRAYMRELRGVYRKMRPTRWNMLNTFLAYPIWRVYLVLEAREKEV